MNQPDLLSALNSPQRSAITAPDGPVLVLAGPGSGKTRVLTHRIAWLVTQRAVPAWKILAVTFTNKAAKEMRSRVERLIDSPLAAPGSGQLWIGTFHAICARILRRETLHLPITADYVIYDTDDQRALMRDVIANGLNLDVKKNRPEAILNAISTAKNEAITPDRYPTSTYKEEITRRAYEMYQQRLIASNAVDFDDLLLHTVTLFQNQPGVLGKYANQFDHVLVDEFQDTNAVQYTLIKQLVSLRRNLFCVGDEDQSIYRWRGADFRNVLRLREDYPDLTTVLLEQNYRSTQTILDAATAVINRNTQRTPKRLFTEQSAGELITINESHNEVFEASFVVDTIAGLIATGEVEPGQCAVMYRTNAQSRVLEDSFVRANLPYRLVGATRFYGRKEIKDLLAYLRILHNPDDSVSLRRVINTPTRGIGDKTVDTLSAWADQMEVSMFTALGHLAAGDASPLSGRARTSLLEFYQRWTGWRTLLEATPLADVLKALIEQTGFEQFVRDGTEEGEDRWANVMELFNLLAEYEELPLSTFLEEIALVSDVDSLTEEVNAPTLLTLHAAKGLEFDVVFITGLEEEILPHSRAKDDPEEMAEERRLLYVGITRARKRLYLLYAFQRTQWGRTELNYPSRFLEDIPESLITGRRARKSSFTPRSEPLAWSLSKADGPPRIPQADRPVQPGERFKVGQKVFHSKFGIGMVIASRASGDDEEVSVVFEDSGLKKLMASFAHLVRVEE
jgi:DNA helicase-2/ATP-dependent DNA helicase PcrA